MPSGREFAIAYEDEHLIVVDKPAGVVVHPGVGHDRGHARRRRSPDGWPAGLTRERPGVVHRLDRDTSGLLVLRALRGGCTLRCRRRCARARSPASTSRWWRGGRPRGAARSTRRSAATGAFALASPPTPTIRHEAVTHFAAERALAEDTLLRVTLETGRTHQIRAHLLAIGHPVVGDPEYGGAQEYGLSRQFLHAERLAFNHPETGASVDLRAPLPEDLVRALRQASGERTDQSV